MLQKGRYENGEWLVAKLAVFRRLGVRANCLYVVFNYFWESKYYPTLMKPWDDWSQTGVKLRASRPKSEVMRTWRYGFNLRTEKQRTFADNILLTSMRRTTFSNQFLNNRCSIYCVFQNRCYWNIERPSWFSRQSVAIDFLHFIDVFIWSLSARRNVYGQIAIV